MVYTHVAAALTGAALAAWGAWNVQAWRYDSRIAVMQQAYAESLQKAEAFARQREQALVQSRQKVEEQYAQEKRKAAAAASRARTELDGLRDELAAGAAQAGANPTAACRPDAGTLERQLLGQCASALVDLAAETDRLAAQVLGLQGYVRQVCLKAD